MQQVAKSRICFHFLFHIFAELWKVCELREISFLPFFFCLWQEMFQSITFFKLCQIRSPRRPSSQIRPILLRIYHIKENGKHFFWKRKERNAKVTSAAAKSIQFRLQFFFTRRKRLFRSFFQENQRKLKKRRKQEIRLNLTDFFNMFWCMVESIE